DENGRVRGIDLPENRRVGEVARELTASSDDGGLDVLRGTIDIAIEIELKRYGCEAKGAGGRHLGDARDLRELAFERRRHRGRHGLGTRTGQVGRNNDGGKVDLRQGSDRKSGERDDAGQKDRGHQQGGCNRSLNKRGRDAHPAVPYGVHYPTGFADLSVGLAWTRVPARNLYWPSRTTWSPAASPSSMMETPSRLYPALIGRCSTDLPALTPNANGPFGPRCTTCVGTVKTS